MQDVSRHDKTFDRIVAAAIAGERCPMNDQLPTGAMTCLVRAGKIRVEVFEKNFRRVTILVGQHAGKTSADPPRRLGDIPEPYLVSDARGTFRNGVPVEPPRAAKRPITLQFNAGHRR